MVILFLIVLLFTSSPKNQASACPACWAGYGSGDERFNKPLADLRILYEKEGRGALPVIRELAKSHDDPVVKDRAISYLVELEDKAIVPMLEDIITDLTKRVSFSSFGRDSLDFQRRLRAAHALGKLGSTTKLVNRIWEKYNRLDHQRKAEIPYLLNALKDPQLTERLLEILAQEKDHQLVLGAIEVLGMGGDLKAVPFLEGKIKEWEVQKTTTTESISAINYSVLKIKAEQACFAINEREKSSSSP